jgi:Ca2+-binding RTX toxin-like protein
MGDNNLNQGIFTTMSYMDGNPANFSSHSDAGYGYQATPMAFDIAAIQELYGANNSYNTGNNTYTLATVNAQNSNTYWSCIWDAGGTDTISNSGSSIACTINLNEAPLTGANAGGYISSNSGINGGFTIANGATIENATGGSGNDTLTGNSANNTLDGGSGNDTMVGGSGDDTYVVDSTSDVVTEASSEGTDTIQSSVSFTASSNVENLTLTGSSNIDATGNSSNNTLTGNSGNNEIDGNGGTDTVIFSDTKANVITSFGFHHNDTSAIVIKGTYGTDTIVDCENIQFSDGTISVADLRNQYASDYKPLFANATSGEASFMMADTYTGAVSGVQWQYLAEIGLDGNTVIGSTGNDFMNLLGGDDAANGGAGDDILDGGRGSNFLTGGSGTDTFFLDGRGSSSVIWSTITDWDNTEELSVWGWGSNSTISWEENKGTTGYEGATFSIDLNGNGVVDMKCTFTGFAVADIKSATEFEDNELLWFV